MSTLLCRNIDEAKRCLDEHGVCVLQDVLELYKCDIYREGFEEWLDSFPENRKPNSDASLIQSYSIAHHESAWAVRLAVKPVFEKIWGTSKLHSSTDGIAVGEPPELGSNRFEDDIPGRHGLHIDQCSKRKGLHAYQGAVYLEESLEDDWCFMVLLKSHKYHEEFFNTHEETGCTRVGGDEYRCVTSEEQAWYHKRGCVETRIPIPKGGIILWDSRTVHNGAPPKRNRPNHDRWRFVVFVSMNPAIWSLPEDIQRKVEAYRDLKVSFHWSTRGFGLFSNQEPRPGSIKSLPEIAQSDSARLLVGDLVYDFNDELPNGPEWQPVFA